MIATLNEIKTLLQISDTSKDDLIDTLTPLVENDIVDYTNAFRDKVNYVSSNSWVFTDATTPTISSVSNNFVAGQMIFVEGSMLNDGVYTIDSVSGNTININSLYSLSDENSNYAITIYPLLVPKALKLIFAQMVNFRLDKYINNIKSESLGDYSVTYGSEATNMINGYPANIIQQLNKYRKLRW